MPTDHQTTRKVRLTIYDRHAVEVLTVITKDDEKNYFNDEYVNEIVGQINKQVSFSNKLLNINLSLSLVQFLYLLRVNVSDGIPFPIFKYLVGFPELLCVACAMISIILSLYEMQNETARRTIRTVSKFKNYLLKDNNAYKLFSTRWFNFDPLHMLYFTRDWSISKFGLANQAVLLIVSVICITSIPIFFYVVQISVIVSILSNPHFGQVISISTVIFCVICHIWVLASFLLYFIEFTWETESEVYDRFLEMLDR